MSMPTCKTINNHFEPIDSNALHLNAFVLCAQPNRARNTVHYHYWYIPILFGRLSLPLFVLFCGTAAVVVATTHLHLCTLNVP